MIGKDGKCTIKVVEWHLLCHLVSCGCHLHSGYELVVQRTYIHSVTYWTDIKFTVHLDLVIPCTSKIPLQDYREQRAEELMGVLNSLWEALEVEQEDVDRGIFVRLMSGPARLHGKSIQKVCNHCLTAVFTASPLFVTLYCYTHTTCLQSSVHGLYYGYLSDGCRTLHQASCQDACV